VRTSDFEWQLIVLRTSYAERIWLRIFNPRLAICIRLRV
jgi:hypothetical protein